MRRHDTDAVSLVAGALFLVVAAVHFSAGATDTELRLHWLVPAMLVILGVVGLLGALRGTRGDERPVAVSGTDAGAGPDAVAEPTEEVARDEDPDRT